MEVLLRVALALSVLAACAPEAADPCQPTFVDDQLCGLYSCWTTQADGAVYFAWGLREDGSFAHRTRLCAEADCVAITYEVASAAACPD